MRLLTVRQPEFKRFWISLLKRENLDTNQVRRDALTLKVFGKPVSVQQGVEIIRRAVLLQGDRAALKYTRLLEGAALTPETLRISAAERKAAEKKVLPAIRRAIQECAAHIHAYHKAQKPRRAAKVRRPGVFVTERCRPLQRVGIYVPGGNAPLVSTVLMNAIPAVVAGVRDIIMCTPASARGTVADALLAAANIAGVKDVYRLGGAVAVSAMAYGTATLPKVDKIVGPGNMFTTEAKRQVVGQVGIDHLAGPSEILIVADDSAQPVQVAWDLLGQCEHGSGAVAILLSPSRPLVDAVFKQLSVWGERDEWIRRAIQGVSCIQVGSLKQAFDFTREYAPEHLSLQMREAHKHLDAVGNSGAIFMGAETPQAMGDYTAGPNHVLPTGGTSRWASPLSVRDFLHYSSVITYTRAGVKREGAGAMAVAEAEGLKAHAQSIRVRM